MSVMELYSFERTFSFKYPQSVIISNTYEAEFIYLIVFGAEHK